ncbi:MAG: hypothetical protein OXH70_17540 [Acidobacteria bacterium]|nr:hypothetical protein [Acidobacteriota bacterium]
MARTLAQWEAHVVRLKKQYDDLCERRRRGYSSELHDEMLRVGNELTDAQWKIRDIKAGVTPAQRRKLNKAAAEKWRRDTARAEARVSRMTRETWTGRLGRMAD